MSSANMTEAIGWLSVMENATLMFSKDALMAQFVDAEQNVEMPDNVMGGYINISGNGCSFESGVLATEEDCQKIAAMFVGETDLSKEDVADCFGEIANIVCGDMIRFMTQEDEAAQHDMRLGLPVFITGSFIACVGQSTAVAKITIDDATLYLVILYPSASVIVNPKFLA